MKVMESSIKRNWNPQSYKTQQIKILQAEGFLNKESTLRLKSLVYNTNETEMRELGLTLLHGLWQQHVNKIINKPKYEKLICCI